MPIAPIWGLIWALAALMVTRCDAFFHHWAFDGAGQCQDIPCQVEIPPGAQIQAYATEEKYGFIWVYPDKVASTTVAGFDELKGQDLAVAADKPSHASAITTYV